MGSGDRLWNSDDPQPEDLDAALNGMDGWEFGQLPANPDAKLTFTVDVDADDFARLEEISAARGEKPREVISELIRSASNHAA